MTFFCLGVTLAVQFPSRVTREYSFRHFQETFGSLAARIPDRADGRVHRIGGLCPLGLDQPEGFTVRHYDCQPHGGQPYHSSPIRLPPPVRGVPVPVELGRVFAGPNHVWCDLRRECDSLPAVDQN